jgi:hypothetical protein
VLYHGYGQHIFSVQCFSSGRTKKKEKEDEAVSKDVREERLYFFHDYNNVFGK